MKNIIIEASINHVQEHYNRVCRSNIPAVWIVRCENLDELLPGNWEYGEYGEYGYVTDGQGSHRSLYAEGWTKEEAIEGFKKSAKGMFPGGGKIRFV